MDMGARAATRKWIKIVLLGDIIFSTLNVQANTLKAQDPRILLPDLQKIIQRGRLIVGVNAEDHPPFHMRDKDGKLIGIDVEVAETIAKHLKVPIEYIRRSRDFDEVINLVVKGEADIALSKLSYTPERALRASFSKPYIMLHKAILVNRIQLARFGETLSLKELLGLKGIKVGTLAGSSYAVFAKEIFPPSIEFFTDTVWTNIITKVESGECFGAFRDDNEIRKILIKTPKMNLNALAIVLKEEEDPICVVLPLGQQEFLHWINDLLTNVKSLRFELGAVLKKYKNNL